MRMTRKGWGVMLALLALMLAFVPQTKAISTTTSHFEFVADQMEASVNGSSMPLEVSALVQNGVPYIPASFLAAQLGISLTWNAKTSRVEMVPNAAIKVEFDLANKIVYFNSITSSFDNICMLNPDGRLLLRLSWFADFIGAKWEFNPDTKGMKLVYVPQAGGLEVSGSDNSKPVAKFTFAKSSYRMGEPVQYVDLSYDPDAEGIASYEWTGNKPVFNEAGKFPVTLRVTDSAGHRSDLYTRYITIEPVTYLSDLQYRLQFTPVGTSFATTWSELWGNFHDLPELNKDVAVDKTRSLLVSDSPETIKTKGVLYRDTVNGKARLYADHINGTDQRVQFTIMAHNTGNKPVTVKTTNKGEVYPSIYANIIGNEASIDFMLHDPVNKNPLVIPPGQSYVYVMMPDFYPGQGVNVFYDVETDGPVEFSFLAMDNVQTPNQAWLDSYKPLDFNGNVRGTFEAADKTWNVDLKDLKSPSRIVIGDGISDPFVNGYDTFRMTAVKNEGNYGMIYKVHADNPRRMAVLLVARGGVFKGPFKVGGQFVMVPKSGVLPAFDQVFVLARTTGTENAFDLEFTPPAGSAFPIDIIFYPLDELPK